MKLQPTIAFYVAAGAESGLGHLMRCISLAESLPENIKALFKLATPDQKAALFLEEQGLIGAVGSREADYSSGGEPDFAATDLLIVDVPNLTEKDRSILSKRKPSTSLLMFHDEPVQVPDVDVFIQPHIVEAWRPARTSQSEGQIYLGPDYWVLRSVFDKFLGRTGARSSKVSQVLVMMGGAGRRNELLAVVNVIASTLTGCTIDVVCGPFLSDIPQVSGIEKCGNRVQFWTTPPDISSQMAHADLAVTAGGYSVYELAALGTPMLIIPTVEHQHHTAEAMKSAGCAVTAETPYRNQHSNLPRVLSEIALDSKKRKSMSVAGMTLVDGHGRERVLKIMASLLNLK